MEETGDPQRREARGDGTRRSLGDGHAPGVEGNPSRLEQVRQLWKVFLQEDEMIENLQCLNILRRNLDNCQSLELS